MNAIVNISALDRYRDRLDSIIDSIESAQWLKIKDLLATNQSIRPDFLGSS